MSLLISCQHTFRGKGVPCGKDRKPEKLKGILISPLRLENVPLSLL